MVATTGGVGELVRGSAPRRCVDHDRWEEEVNEEKMAVT